MTRRLWLVLVAALGFVALDSVARLRAIHAATDARFTPAVAIERDSTTASGYYGNQHRVFAPVEGIDGEHWVMQTQQMVHDHDWRVRHTDYDGPPAGRDVHWSVPVRWATAAIATIAGVATGTSVTQSVESVSPWVGIVLFGAVLLILCPVIARRFGAFPAGIFVVACVTVYPFYQMFEVGILDHHGLVAVCALCTALFLAAGGAGWTRDETVAAKPRSGDAALLAWLPTQMQARPWFIASGVSGAAGLWINAATQVPVLVSVGVAALVASVWFSRSQQNTYWRVSPALWRLWGIAGAAASLVFFALEYLPGHITMHLEVNHPLYAIAWAGAGDAMSRIFNRMQSRGTARDVAWLALDAIAVATIPVVMIAIPESFAVRPGSLLLRLHEQYISEFRGLFTMIAPWSWAQINASIGILPLLMLAPAMLLATSRKLQAPIRAIIALTAIPALCISAVALRQMRWMNIAIALWIGALVALCFILIIVGTEWNPRRIMMGVAMSAVAAIIPLIALSSSGANAMRPFMWITLGVALWASTQVGVAATSAWTSGSLTLAGVALGLAFLPRPVSVLYTWIDKGWTYRADASDVAQIMTRDVAQQLRARLGAERGTVLGGPTTSTWMTYYGGMRSISTFYWENAEGIALGRDVLGAPDPDSARKLIEANGITHIVLCSWDAMAFDYAAVAPNARVPGDVFARQLLSGKIPTWLRPVPYTLPALPYFKDPWVRIYEVAPLQAREESLVRLGEYNLAVNPSAQSVTPLNNALEVHPNYLPALIHLANAQFGIANIGDARATMQRIRSAAADTTRLAFEDEVFLAFAFALDADSAQAHRALARALAKADERAVRRLAPDNAKLAFVEMAQRLHLDKDPRGAVALAQRLLPGTVPAQVNSPAR